MRLVSFARRLESSFLSERTAVRENAMLTDQGNCTYDWIQFRPCVSSSSSSIRRLSFRHDEDALIIMSVSDYHLNDRFIVSRLASKDYFEAIKSDARGEILVILSLIDDSVGEACEPPPSVTKPSVIHVRGERCMRSSTSH